MEKVSSYEGPHLTAPPGARKLDAAGRSSCVCSRAHSSQEGSVVNGSWYGSFSSVHSDTLLPYRSPSLGQVPWEVPFLTRSHSVLIYRVGVCGTERTVST